MILVAAAILIAAATGFACFTVRDRSRIVSGLERQAVIVTLKDGAGFRGVLFDADRAAMVLRDVESFGTSARPVPVDGSIVVFRADIAYVQRP